MLQSIYNWKSSCHEADVTYRPEDNGDLTPICSECNEVCKRKTGRPTDYTDEMPQRMIDYFDKPPTTQIINRRTSTVGKEGDENEKETVTYRQIVNELPTFEAFALSIGHARSTLQKWAEEHPEFSVAYEKCKQLQKRILIHNGLADNYHAGFAIFVAKNVTDMKDVKTLEGGDADKPVRINIFDDETDDDETGTDGDAETEDVTQETQE